MKLEIVYEDIKAILKHGFQPYISSVETEYEDIKARLKHGFQPYIFSSSYSIMTIIIDPQPKVLKDIINYA